MGDTGEVRILAIRAPASTFPLKVQLKILDWFVDEATRRIEREPDHIIKFPVKTLGQHKGETIFVLWPDYLNEDLIERIKTDRIYSLFDELKELARDNIVYLFTITPAEKRSLKLRLGPNIRECTIVKWTEDFMKIMVICENEGLKEIEIN